MAQRWQPAAYCGAVEGRRAAILDTAGWDGGESSFFLSTANLYAKDSELYITDTVSTLTVWRLAEDGDPLFAGRHFQQPVKKPGCTLRPMGALEQAQWLVTSVPGIDASTLLYHREFQKEFSVGDPAGVRSARLVLAVESECRVRINDKWVDQPVRPGVLNVLDVTGYVQRGDNVLLMDFPFVKGEKAFAGRMLVEYFNTNRLDFYTDTSWLATDLYYFPATYGDKPVYPLAFAAPKVATDGPGYGGATGMERRRALSGEGMPGFLAWNLTLPCDYLNGLNNLYLDVNYQGDRISVRHNGRLIADNLNNNTRWLMDLKRTESSLECQDLGLEVRPWKGLDRMYFDRAPLPGTEGTAAIEGIRLVPEYRVVTRMDKGAALTPGSPKVDTLAGQDWLDTDGHVINAHGAGVLYHDSVYYLFGEIKKGPTRLVANQGWEDYRVAAGGVSCYSSRDLVHWKYRGVALAATIGDTASDLDTGRVIERPKVIYNSETKKFVLWMHIDRNDYSHARAGVAVSDRPEGPYRYLGSCRPNGEMSRDMTVFKDDDGRAYLVYASENNNTMQVCLLSNDYLSPTPVYKRIFVGQRREAPAVFKSQGHYYLITSLCSGWDPNAARYGVADSLLGEWRQQGNPCVGSDSAITFGAQSSYVLPMGRDRFVFMADRWNKTDLERSGYLWLPLRVVDGRVEIRDSGGYSKRYTAGPLSLVNYSFWATSFGKDVKSYSFIRFYNSTDSLLLEYRSAFSDGYSGNYTETPPGTAYLVVGARGILYVDSLSMERNVGEPVKRHASLCDLGQYLRPFWNSDTIFNETVLLYSVGGAPAMGRLLYQPDRILSVRNYGLDTSYARGVDYRVEGRTILRLAGSKMPWRADTSFSKKDLAWYNLQSQWVVVSYTHRDRWKGAVPAYSGDQLPRLMDKLRSGLPVTIVAYGMSITRGMDVSSYDGVAPYMPHLYGAFCAGIADAVSAYCHRVLQCRAAWFDGGVGGRNMRRSMCGRYSLILWCWILG